MWGLFKGREVDFIVEPPPFTHVMKNIFRIRVKGVTATDDSIESESWFITGGIVGMGQLSREPNPMFLEQVDWKSCKIYFNTQRRVGDLHY